MLLQHHTWVHGVPGTRLDHDNLCLLLVTPQALRTSPYGELGLIMAIPPLVPSAHQRPFMDKSVLTELEKDVKYWSVMVGG
jgi:hypothetical protein